MSLYHVLQQVALDPPRFDLVAENVGARDGQAAIRAHLEKSDLFASEPVEQETYVPVPSRSWQPVTVQARTEVRLHMVAEEKPKSTKSPKAGKAAK